MIETELAQKIADFQGKGYVVAPAGFGKTHLIALALNATNERQLILTHTFAGVNALQRKMRLLGVASSKYKIDTIASWALRLSLAYPNNANWNIEQPSNNDEWQQLYNACTALLTKGFIKKIVRASYAGLYVDEYQDCSFSQHNLISALSELLPCRLLGDPMQAIFDFAEKPVDWVKDVSPNYEHLGNLETPWRWNNVGANDIGEWLIQVRHSLENGEKIDLVTRLPRNVTFSSVDLNDFTDRGRLNTFYKFRGEKGNVVAIYPGDAKHKTFSLAKNLAGEFSAIEEIEGKELFAFLENLSKKNTATDRLNCVIAFSKVCMGNVGKALTAATKRGEMTGITANTKYPIVADAANRYYNNSSSSNLEHFLVELKNNPETNLSRRDLFNRVLQVLVIHKQNPDITLVDAAKKFQVEFRHKGRPIRHNRIIGTTLLVKGLEFDHVIVLDAESLPTKELYVALTRGAKSITIISSNAVLPAK